MDEDEKADHAASDNTKVSKRDRFKGALARTKSKFKKHGDRHEESDNILDEDVNEFLSAGRTSTSSWTSGHDPHPSTLVLAHPSAAPVSNEQSSSRPSTADSLAKPKQSPRRIVVPRIDVSNSQRWPAARPVVAQDYQDGSDFLRPAYHTRSQSASSLSKRKGRGRGLSVTFIEAPPVVIGEGGEQALIPPVEISKARARARSFSPMSSRSQSYVPPTTHGTRFANHPNAQQPSVTRHDPPDILRPRGLRRVQTGMSPANSASHLDKEFEMTLRLGSGVKPPDSRGLSHTPEIISPRPMRPVRPPPPVSEIPEPYVNRELAKGDSRKHSKEGDILRLHHESDMSDNMDDVSPGAASSRGTSLEEHQPSQWI
ncbi:hypothetical protein A1O1_06988 [Capronia coronata CBS 617.96]|uniref:Uncharacterized protein n=1 Tax=Capronia coronata CBS 617.96 TaxID=1182541 RepID=W9XS63_9EURO|nr:uncharacterized protein A1O1_06988 [Capronia coronata CBS 617.96]EXJ83367.1 hypothetical protein A1O1_06988 [Capronia coronata CBS 617.96]